MGTTHLELPQCHLLKEWKDYPDGWIEEQYERHNQHVIDHVPSDNLLVFNVKEGWKPLCEFLGKPVHDKPFPHVKVNTSAGLLELKGTLEMVVYLWIPVLLLIAAMLFWACCFRKKREPKHAKTE